MNTFPRSGNLKAAEIKPLILAAKTAYDRQADAGLLSPSETFDDWRHAQCVAAVGKPGLTACHHDDFQPLLAHFYTLSGDTEKAYEAAMKTGKPADAHSWHRLGSWPGLSMHRRADRPNPGHHLEPDRCR